MKMSELHALTVTCSNCRFLTYYTYIIFLKILSWFFSITLNVVTKSTYSYMTKDRTTREMN